MPRKVVPELTRSRMMENLVDSLRRTAVKPTIYGYNPMPKQRKFHSSLAKGRQFLGGNRAGKTVAGICEDVMWLTGNHQFRDIPPPPIRGRIIAVDFNQGVEKIILPELAKWIPPSCLIDNSWEKSYSSRLRTLTLANGSFVELMSYEMDLEKFAGTSRHFVHFDEEPSKAIFNENMARLVDVGGSWWLTMTPVDGMTWTYDDIYVEARTNPNFFTVQSEMDENIYLSSVEIDMLLSTMNQDEKLARRKGQYVQLGGLIYKMFGPDNIVPSLLHSSAWKSVKDHWQFVCAMDHGFHNPTAWLWAALSPDGKIVIFDEHYESEQIIAYHANIVLQKNRMYGIEPVYFVGDPSIRNTDPITATSVQIEYVNCGIPITLGNNDVKAGINAVAKMFESRQLLITANCLNTIKELARYRWSTWSSKRMQGDRNLKEEPHKKNDHACDALRYLIASRPQFETESRSVVENIFNAPSVLDPNRGRIDTELLTNTVTDPEFAGAADYYLGAEY